MYYPNSRRWISRDPILFDGGVNLWEYVKGNPVRYVDPDGKNALAVAGPVGWGAAGVSTGVSYYCNFVNPQACRDFYDWGAQVANDAYDFASEVCNDHGLNIFNDGRFKGGTKGKRDRNFGIEDKDFWNWWHRGDGKKENGGKNIGSKGEADGIYDDWAQGGRPKGPKPRS